MQQLTLSFMQRHQSEYLHDDGLLMQSATLYLENSLKAIPSEANHAVSRAYSQLQQLPQKSSYWIDLSRSNSDLVVVVGADGQNYTVPVAAIAKTCLHRPLWSSVSRQQCAAHDEISRHRIAVGDETPRLFAVVASSIIASRLVLRAGHHGKCRFWFHSAANNVAPDEYLAT